MSQTATSAHLLCNTKYRPGKVIAAAAGTALLADVLLRGWLFQALGLSHALVGLTFAGLFIAGRSTEARPGAVTCTASIAALSCLWLSIAPNAWSWLVVPVVLAWHMGACSGPEGWWRRIGAAAVDFLRAPRTTWRILAAQRASSDPAGATGARWRAAASVVVPAVAVLIPIAALLTSGNAVMAHGFDAGWNTLCDLFALLELPGPARFLLWGCWFAAACCALAIPPRPAVHASPPGDPAHPTAATPWSGSDVARARFIMVGGNALFLTANSVDLLFLWSGRPLPAGVTLSQYVHHGAWHLFLAGCLTALVISVLFRTRPGCASPSLDLRVGGGLWLAQVLALIAGVALRLFRYVDAYGLTLSRLHLAGGLAASAACLVALSAVLWRQRDLSWHWRTHGRLLFIALLATQLVDGRAWCARWNAHAALARPNQAPDLEYMAHLGNAAWPALADLATNHPAPSVRGGASGILARAARETTPLDWRAWTLAEASRRAALDRWIASWQRRVS